MVVRVQVLVLCVCVAAVKSQTHWDKHFLDRPHPNLPGIMNSLNEMVSNSLLGHFNPRITEPDRNFDSNNFRRPDISGGIEFNLKPPGRYGSGLFGSGWLNQNGDRGNIEQDINIVQGGKYQDKNYDQDNFGGNPQSNPLGGLQSNKNMKENSKYNPSNEQDIVSDDGKENAKSLIDQNDQEQKNRVVSNNLPSKIQIDINADKEANISEDQTIPAENSLLAKQETKSKNNLNIDSKVPAESNDVKDSKNSLDGKTIVSSDLNNDKVDEKSNDSSEEVKGDNKFDSTEILKGILMIDPELNDNNANIEIDKQKDLIVLPQDVNKINVNNKYEQSDKSQPSSIPYQIGKESNEHLYGGNTAPQLITSRNPNSLASNPTSTFGVPSNQPPASNMRYVPQSNFQTADIQNQNAYNQPNGILVNNQNPNSQMPVNNVMSNEYNFPSSNNVVPNPNNGILNGYVPVTVPAGENSGNSNDNNNLIYITNNKPVSSTGQTNGGYYQVLNSPQQYYIVQLGNGQTILVPVNNQQNVNPNYRQATVVPGNTVQPNVLNNAQLQYVPVNSQNIVQVPINNQPTGQLQTTGQIVQIPSQGQAVYQVVGPNNPQGNAIVYTNPVKVMQVAPTNNNVVPMVISYKDKEEKKTSTENIDDEIHHDS